MQGLPGRNMGRQREVGWGEWHTGWSGQGFDLGGVWAIHCYDLGAMRCRCTDPRMCHCTTLR